MGAARSTRSLHRHACGNPYRCRRWGKGMSPRLGSSRRPERVIDSAYAAPCSGRASSALRQGPVERGAFASVQYTSASRTQKCLSARSSRHRRVPLLSQSSTRRSTNLPTGATSCGLLHADLPRRALSHARQRVERIRALLIAHLLDALVELALVHAMRTLAGIEVLFPVIPHARQAVLCG